VNKAQKATAVLTVAILVGMALYPPWICTDARGVVRHGGHSFILNPPRTTAEAMLINTPVRCSVDWEHLMKGWLYVAGLGVPLTILLRTRRTKDREYETASRRRDSS